jgi:hypothetical protein
MRRIVLGIRGVLLGIAVLMAGIGVLAHSSLAQGAADESLSGHPVVGAWSLLTEDGEISVVAFTSDGVLIDAEQDGSSGIGSWQAADDTTAAFTFILLASEEDSSYSITIRGTFAVNGDTADVMYSVTAIGNDGTVFFAGEGTGTAARIPVEGPELAGSPVAGFPIMPATPEP